MSATAGEQRPALPPMTSGMVAVTGSGFAERRVSAGPEPVALLAETSGADDPPQAVTEARSAAARVGLNSLVMVMFLPACKLEQYSL